MSSNDQAQNAGATSAQNTQQLARVATQGSAVQASDRNATIMSGDVDDEMGNPMEAARKDLDPILKELNGVIDDLDVKLNSVLKKHEHDYLKGYSIYVKQKEKELRELVNKLNDQNNQGTTKDSVIQEQLMTVKKLTQDQAKLEQDKTALKEKIRYHSQRSNNFEQDKNFLQAQIVDCKRQNKLLKLALGRLQEECDAQAKIIKEAGLDNPGTTYVTELKAEDSQHAIEANDIDDNDQEEQPAMLDYVEHGQPQKPVKKADNLAQSATYAPGSLLDSQLLQETNAGTSYFDSKLMQSNLKARTATKSPNKTHTQSSNKMQVISNYKYLPTVNTKFEKFLDHIMKPMTGLSTEDMKTEIVKYVQALETSYTEAIKDMKAAINTVQKEKSKVLNKQGTVASMRSEMEQLFVHCIEEVRKEVMKRRLKTELYNKKKFPSFEHLDGFGNTAEAREFEESLLKLAQLSKKKVKIEDFTAMDRYHLLDLFVNNEKTLLKVYEALFPHRATAANTGGLISGSSSMMQNPSQSASGMMYQGHPQSQMSHGQLKANLVNSSMHYSSQPGSGRQSQPTLAQYGTAPYTQSVQNSIPQTMTSASQGGANSNYGGSLQPKRIGGVSLKNHFQSVDQGNAQRITMENHAMMQQMQIMPRSSGNSRALPQIAK